MIFVHGSLALGGVETFFIRMAKERLKRGLKTTIVLLSDESSSNPDLLSEARKYASVYFISDLLFFGGFLTKILPPHAYFFLPLNMNKVFNIFHNAEHVHVSCGWCAVFSFIFFKKLGENIPLSIGLYHSLEFVWKGLDKNLPYFEMVNRKIFFNILSDKNIIFFNDNMINFYNSHNKRDFSKVNLFPLGVISKNTIVNQSMERPNDNHSIRICSVGRLEYFKKYNLWMVDVVANLKQHGCKVIYDIYGNGTLYNEINNKINTLGLSDNISLRGNLDYSKFCSTIMQYDLFIGSGTAIVEAAGLGIPSIIGIENIETPQTYGFFCDIKGFSYNEDGMPQDKVGVEELIYNYMKLNDNEIASLSEKNKNKAELFSIESCVDNFNGISLREIDISSVKNESSLIGRIRYACSLFLYSIRCRMSGKTLSSVVRESP
ncbi:glycosyltransferase family protein [Limnobaculum xujianqingii]|uniref:glycosyltransferase n=1 Tax=Limnobaculum xujianqingii TaxID=2738837 RepID=UPI0011288668|nr:glycosyltransferase [Limnobaculum xujianqingii]